MCDGGCAAISRALGGQEQGAAVGSLCSCPNSRQRGHSVSALIPDSPRHGPDLHILYPNVVCEGSTPWGGWFMGSAGLTALQDT